MPKLFFAAVCLVAGLGALLGYRAAHHTDAQSVTAPHTVSTKHVGESSEPQNVTIASVFAPRGPNLGSYPRRNLRTLVATGDVIPGRSVNYKMVTYGDFLYPFRPTARFLRKGDTTLINLESPLIANCPITDSGMSFCGDPRAVEGIQYAGVDVACTANNHIGNYGDAGIAETWTHLQDAHIGVCGLGRIFYRVVRGMRFAFLAYNCVGERFPYAVARNEIRKARHHADIVVVSVHWGKEYVGVPTTEPGIADDDPVQVAHFIIDSGADLIIGNHPHHVQAIEIYHGKFIAYAHGNFAFDQMFSDDTRSGVIGVYTFYKRRLVSVRYHPIFIYDYAQARWATLAQSRHILGEMASATRQLAALLHQHHA